MLNISAIILFVVLISICCCCRAIEYNKYAEIVDKITQNDTKIGSSCVNVFKSMDFSNSTGYELLSAWSSFNSSHNYGNSHDFGDITICKNFDVTKLSTQYCLVQYYSPNMKFPISPKTSPYQNIWNDLDVSFLGAVCVPSSCSIGDVKEVLKLAFGEKNLTFGDKIYCKNEFNKKSEDVIEKLEIPMLSWLNLERVLLFTGILSVTLILSLLKIEKLNLVHIIKDLFNFNAKASSTAYLNGFKAIATLLIVFYHCLISRMIYPFKNGDNLQELLTGAFYQPIQAIGSIMEIFFIIGGILSAKSLSKDFGKSSSKLKWILSFYIKRFSRLVPVTALILLLTVTSNSENFAPYSFGIEKENCKKFWWMALTFNFMDMTEIYTGYIWFVSVYLQLTLAAPFVFWGIKHEKFGNFFKIFVLLAATVIRFYHTFDGYYEMLFTDKGFDNFHDEIFAKYISTCYRLLPFFGGMLMQQFLNKESKVKNFITVIPALLLFFFTLALFFTSGKMQIPYLPSILDIISVYCLLILLISCYHSDGIVKKFLSSNFWTPISKMGLSIYLISAYIQFSIYERQLEPLEIKNELEFILMFFKDVLIVTVPILLSFLFIEEPFSKLGEILAAKIQCEKS